MVDTALYSTVDNAPPPPCTAMAWCCMAYCCIAAWACGGSGPVAASICPLGDMYICGWASPCAATIAVTTQLRLRVSGVVQCFVSGWMHGTASLHKNKQQANTESL